LIIVDFRGASGRNGRLAICLLTVRPTLETKLGSGCFGLSGGAENQRGSQDRGCVSLEHIVHLRKSYDSMKNHDESLIPKEAGVKYNGSGFPRERIPGIFDG
jgi:hypothetical protein